jgi:dTDP-4-dehydrorhamnose 3,5-epimerase
MNRIETLFPGLLILEPRVISDRRGYFFESWHTFRYSEAGITANFVQDNESKSVRGVLRGLHYQLNPWSQAKLVRVVQGKVYDVVVDLRKGSPAFGRWYGMELDDESKKQLFIPRGFAHGFSVLSETAIFSYKCDNVYNSEYERTINPNDPLLNIDWKLGSTDSIISEKDLKAPGIADAELNFNFDAK